MPLKPLHDFNKLNDLVSIYRPNSVNKKVLPESESRAPDLVVVCSWVGAAPKHIAKYTDGYKRLFPDANVLLIQSTVLGMVKPSNITPACDILHSLVQQSTSNADKGVNDSVILHAFSNGGANNAVWLATAFLNRQSRPPFRRIILDCCPGQPEISAISRAITLSLPKHPLVRSIGSWIVYFTILFFMLLVRCLRLEDSISRLRRILNDVEIFSRSTPRLYLYSRADTMVRTEDVHDHAEAARDNGYAMVQEAIFESAPHCALLNEDNERYWNLVKAHVLNLGVPQ